MKNKPGYIIMLTLLILSMAVVLITAVVRQSFSYQRQTRSMQERVRARLLALSSLEIALSQVSFIAPKEKKGKEESQGQQKPEPGKPTAKEADKKEVLQPLQEWALKLLPLINRWHTVEITGEAESLRGVLVII